MKRLFFLIFLFYNPVLAEEYTIYTTQRPPFSWSGVIDDEGFYYDFTNSGITKCDIVAKGCFIRTNIKAEIINKNIIKVQDRYFCSEDHIKAVNKANPKLTKLRYSSLDMGYGNCTKNGWVR